MDGGETSDNEGFYDELRTARNRKQRRAGGWQSMGLDHPVFKGIVKKGFSQPTPIQRKAIPTIIDGKDVVAMSRTGSGKTAAFVIPILQRLKQRDMKGVRVLIIEPTRELAMQTFCVVKELGRFTGLKCAVLVGGDRIEEQFQTIHEKPDILIATPGRLLHVMVEMDLVLNTVRVVVFDEADRLFEMGFAEQLHEVFKRIPENRQALLFSATLPKSIIDFTKAGLSQPVLVRLDVDEKISDKLSMVFLCCRSDDKVAAFLELARQAIDASEQTIIFCATMKHVEYLAAVAQRADIDCVVLYSQLDAVARNINIQKFRRKECFLLIVTDIAARGVDIPLLDVAINYHFPPKPKLYVHRVGRVARAGRVGRAISLLSSDELPYLADLFLFLGRAMKFAMPDTSYDENETLIGSFPDEIIASNIELLKNVHDNTDEVNELLKKSENAMKKYRRTRPPPSSESMRRCKEDLSPAIKDMSVHPYLQNDIPEEAVRQKFLRDLHNFKPSLTVFEAFSSNKTIPAAIMKEKRRKHQKYLREKPSVGSSHSILAASNAQMNAQDNENLLEEAFNTVIRGTKSTTSRAVGEERKKRRKRKAEELQREKNEHFIAYAPLEVNMEKGLAVEKNFGSLAKASAIEISADDEVGLYKQNKRKKWDRKLKRYVGDGDESKKKIRTEDNTLLPASYKSGRYEKWKKKQKVEYRKEEGEDGDNDDTLHLRPMKHSKSRNRGRGRMNDNGSKRFPRTELKNREQILKARRKKAGVQSYQAYRRKQNLKRSHTNKK